MSGRSMIERSITALIAAASSSAMARPIRVRIDELVDSIDEREDVIAPTIRLAAVHSIDKPPPPMDVDQLRWGVRAYASGVIYGLAVATAAHEQKGNL